MPGGRAAGPAPAPRRARRGNGAACSSPAPLEAWRRRGGDQRSRRTACFPRPAEPLPENLGALCETVRAHGCDIGFAQDMDADRLAVVSERGRAHRRGLTARARHLVRPRRKPGPWWRTSRRRRPRRGGAPGSTARSCARRSARQRHRAHAERAGVIGRRRQRRRDLPVDQLARTAGGHGAHPPPCWLRRARRCRAWWRPPRFVMIKEKITCRRTGFPTCCAW